MVVGDFFCKTSPHFANFYFDFSNQFAKSYWLFSFLCVFDNLSRIFFPMQMTHIFTSSFYSGMGQQSLNMWNTNQAMTNWLTIESFLLKLSVALALVATWEQQGDTTAVVAITSCHTFTKMLLLQSLSGSLSRPLGANRGPLALVSNQGPQFCTKRMMDYVLRSCILWEPGQSKTNILNSFPEKSVFSGTILHHFESL